MTLVASAPPSPKPASAIPQPQAAKPAEAPLPTPQIDGIQAVPPTIPTRQTSNFNAEYEARMSQLAGGPAFSPSIEFLRNGDRALQARLNAINSASSSILMTTYALEADEVTSSVLNALIARAKAGVRVVVKSDAFPCTYIQNENSAEENVHMFELLRALEAAGGVVLFYGTEKDMRKNPGAGDHLKLLLTDGKTAIAGGRNMSSDYFRDWRDIDGLFGGTVATKLGRKAMDMAWRSDPTTLNRWTDDRATLIEARKKLVLDQVTADIAQAEKTAKPIGAKCWVVAWDPTYDHRAHGESEQENAISQALIETFDRAKREIIVSSNYVNGTPSVHDAIVRAAKRGVKVHIVTSGEAISDRSIMPYLAAERHYPDIMQYGGRVWERTAVDHGKMYVVDGEVAAFGSYNLEHAANDHLVEQLVFSRDAGFVARIHKELIGDIDEICVEYKHPRKLGFFEGIWRWFQKIFGILTEDFF